MKNDELAYRFLLLWLCVFVSAWVVTHIELYSPLINLMMIGLQIIVSVAAIMAWIPRTRVDKLIKRITAKCLESDPTHFWLQNWARFVLVMLFFEFAMVAKGASLFNFLVVIGLFVTTIWAWFPRNDDGAITPSDADEVSSELKEDWQQFYESLPDSYTIPGPQPIVMKRSDKLPGMYVGDIRHLLD